MEKPVTPQLVRELRSNLDCRIFINLIVLGLAKAYCPILDKTIENYEKDDKAQVMKLFPGLDDCRQSKGKKC